MTGIQSIIEGWDLVAGVDQPPVTSWIHSRLEIDSPALCDGDTMFQGRGGTVNSLRCISDLFLAHFIPLTICTYILPSLP